jgi:hypothetical protein
MVSGRPYNLISLSLSIRLLGMKALEELRLLQEAGPSSEAKAAFKNEILPWLKSLLEKQFLEPANRAMEKSLDDGVWPERRMEQGVMRYKPMKLMDDDFREQVVDAYSDWASSIRKLLK